MNSGNSSPRAKIQKSISIRLAALGCPFPENENSPWPEITAPLLARQQEILRGRKMVLSPVDMRIQQYLEQVLSPIGPVPQLPSRTLILDQAGLARELSLPHDGDVFESPLVKSYRLHNGILHNPASDRRTTKGVFHIAESGMAVPDDKFAVPLTTFARLLDLALQPPKELQVLPYASTEKEPARCLVSLLLRPVVVPAVPGFSAEKRMETRFFAPASLMSNLDFVEGIFGNGGDPFLPQNNAALDPLGWTGHTGCVILAPHLMNAVKHQVGLPHWEIATERQRRDGMCWKDKNEKYNNGQAFKIVLRGPEGVIVTLIADNYFGYCKKEVKSQISYSANLFGNAEEEHAGGALVFPSFDLGNDFMLKTADTHTIEELVAREPERYEVQAEGFATDKLLVDAVVVPVTARFSLPQQSITWKGADGSSTVQIPLSANKVYYLPNGYRVHMEPIAGQHARWRIVGTNPEPTFCHKPCTVSGGGKSEISKAISDAILPGNVFVDDLKEDLDAVEVLLQKDYSGRFQNPPNPADQRSILGAERSIGSVIKLLSPSRSEYTQEYNEWLRTIPPRIKELVFVLKRFYKPEWQGEWRSHFSVDMINGNPANVLKIDGRKIVINTLRVGYETDGSWRVFNLRHDFHPASKVQMEDDITASTVISAAQLKAAKVEVPVPEESPYFEAPTAYKFVGNCESLLFQRPDDAVKRGYDKQAEADIAAPGTFISNYEPLKAADARAIMEDAVNFSAYTEPMQKLIREAAAQADEVSPRYFVSTAHPRLVDGKPSKNVRYLQQRPDLANPKATAHAHNAVRIHRRLHAKDALITPVDVLVPGRRNNPPEGSIRPLCVFNPVHYLPAPEFFMECISSMTGKSPSTTGAGSEGAMTKGPFNALPAVYDLNAALVSLILTGHDAFLTSAGYIGPKVRVDHDISLLVPEVFSRMSADQRTAKRLIEHGYLEKLEDFEHGGRKVLASRLGYRITHRFARIYFGRIFTHPHVVFTDEMMRPEIQDMDIFADSMDNIVVTHQRTAQSYFDDGGVEQAVPPLKALLHIMCKGEFEGMTLESPAFREMFTKENMLASEWYAARLKAKQTMDTLQLRQQLRVLEQTVEMPSNADLLEPLGLKAKVKATRELLLRTQTAEFLKGQVGTLGVLTEK